MAGTELEIVSDLTSEQLKDSLEPKQIVIGNEDEIARIKEVYDTDILADEGQDREPAGIAVAAEPAATAEEPPRATDKRVIAGKEYSAEDAWKALENSSNWAATNTQRAQDLAARKAELDAVEKRILDAINAKIPDQPVVPPALPSIDLSGLPPMPDPDTLEGQEEMKTWLPQALAHTATAAAAAAREATLREVDERLKGVPAATVATVRQVLTKEQEDAESRRMSEYNAGLREEFIRRASEFNMTPFQAKAAVDAIGRDAEEVRDIEPSGPASPLGRMFAIDDLIKAGSRLMNTNHAATVAAEATAKSTLQAVRRGQEAGAVLRSGKAPAVNSLKLSDVNAMSMEEIRSRIVGPMKGRGGKEALGVGPLMKAWELNERLQE